MQSKAHAGARLGEGVGLVSSRSKRQNFEAERRSEEILAPEESSQKVFGAESPFSFGSLWPFGRQRAPKSAEANGSNSEQSVGFSAPSNTPAKCRTRTKSHTKLTDPSNESSSNFRKVRTLSEVPGLLHRRVTEPEGALGDDRTTRGREGLF